MIEQLSKLATMPCSPPSKIFYKSWHFYELSNGFVSIIKLLQLVKQFEFNFYFYFYMVELQEAEKPIFAIIDTL